MEKQTLFKAILLLAALLVGGGNVCGDTYEIVFKSASSDSSSQLGDAPAVSEVIRSGANYVASFSNCVKMLVGKSGIRLGNSSSAGIMHFTLASNYQKNIKSISVVTAKYSDTEGGFHFYINDAANPTASYIDGGSSFTKTFNTPISVSTIKISSIKRVYVTKIIITTVPPEAVTVTSAGLATYVSDNALDYSGVSGLEAYIAKEENNGINLYRVNKVPAGAGVLLRATDGGGKAYNVPLTTASTDDMTGNIFVRGEGAGVESSLEVGSDKYYNYILNKVNNQIGFYRANNQTVATNRAYLHTTVNASSARIDLSFEDQTGISTTLMNDEQSTTDRVFDLQGRHVPQPTKGLYIKNGKKIVVR